MVGFQIIREMTDDELREEILAHQAEELKPMERPHLMQVVVNIRLAQYKKKLLIEANMREGGMFGYEPIENEE